MTLPPTLTAFLAVIVLITIQPLISFSLSDIDTDDAVSALAIASTSPTFESGRLLSHRDVDTNSARRGVALEWQNLLLIPEESSSDERQQQRSLTKIPTAARDVDDVNVSFFPGAVVFLKEGDGCDTADVVGNSAVIDSYYGVDVEIMRTVAGRMRFRPHLWAPVDRLGYGFKVENGNGTFSGMLGDLFSHRTDIIMNTVFIKDYGSDELQFTAALYSDRLNIIVRAPELIPDMWLFFNIFQPSVWQSIATSLLLVSVVYVPIHHISRTFHTPTTRPTPLSTSILPSTMRYDRLTAYTTTGLRMLGTMLSRPEHGFCRTWAERLLLSVSLGHSVVLTGCFQGKLFDVYTHRQTAANVNTIEQLADSDLRLALRYRGLLLDVIGDEQSYSSAAQQRLGAKLLYVDLNTTVYETVLRWPRVADIDRELNFRLVAEQYRRSNGYSSVHVLEESPKTYMLAFAVRKDYPHLERLNSVLLRIVQAGLVRHWYERTLYTRNLRQATAQRTRPPDEVDEMDDEADEDRSSATLSLQQLSVSFGVLIVGLAISAGCFVLELVMVKKGHTGRT